MQTMFIVASEWGGMVFLYLIYFNYKRAKNFAENL